MTDCIVLSPYNRQYYTIDIRIVSVFHKYHQIMYCVLMLVGYYYSERGLLTCLLEHSVRFVSL